jgi:hypothetical protein
LEKCLEEFKGFVKDLSARDHAVPRTLIEWSSDVTESLVAVWREEDAEIRVERLRGSLAFLDTASKSSRKTWRSFVRTCTCARASVFHGSSTRIRPRRVRSRRKLINSRYQIPSPLPQSIYNLYHNQSLTPHLLHSGPPPPNSPHLHAHKDDHAIRQTRQRTLED